MDEVLRGGRFATPVRRGDTVERAAGPGAETVHALLRHFDQAGFRLAPQFIGMTSDGQREILSFIAGETGYPPLAPALRSTDALTSVARAIRAMHDATQDFLPVSRAPAPRHEICVPAQIDCIGHYDLAPWNIVFNGSDVAGIIDWDTAAPSSRLWDLCYAAHHFVPFTPTPDLETWGWDAEPDRAARLRLFALSYGPEIRPAEVVDLAIVRLAAMAAHIEQQSQAGHPVHREDNHAPGYRRAVQFIIGNREHLLR